MDGEKESTHGELVDLLEWWVESGVDVAVRESPRDWLSPAPAGASSGAMVANVAEPSHETLAALHGWLASSLQLPLASPSARRILPHGPEGAEVMLLSDSPALEDFASGQPIGGEAWALAVRMLAAIGLRPEDAYSASLSCFHAPGEKMSAKDLAECADIARRHVGLVRPKRLLLLGDGPCRALLGQSLIESRGHVHKIAGVRTIATFHPRFLLGRPGDKAKTWADLLLLMEEAA